MFCATGYLQKPHARILMRACVDFFRASEQSEAADSASKIRGKISALDRQSDQIAQALADMGV
jgi:hypothetical protein